VRIQVTAELCSASTGAGVSLHIKVL